MSFRARFTLLAGAAVVAVSGLVIAVPLWWRSRLPDPIAIHWGLSGAPDGSSSFAAFAVLPRDQLDVAASLGITVHELHEKRASLEEAFMTLTDQDVEYHGQESTR